jgi:transcriptional regulator of heat shock response
MVQLPTDRQVQLLNRIIEEYIQTAEPVSSKTIAASGAFDVRSATIRNEMADLEEMGFLAQLHTSGGRIPTARAYRLYVNDLIAREGVQGLQLGHTMRHKVDEALNETDLRDPEAVNRTLARLIGQLSGNLVMANTSEREDAYKVGLSNMLAFPEFREMDRLMGLTSFFDHFELMFARMQGSMWRGHDSDVKVMIGTESPYKEVHDETVVVARYRLPKGHEGSLTLVGPMRMDYRKNLGLMTYAAQIANRIADNYRN